MTDIVVEGESGGSRSRRGRAWPPTSSLSMLVDLARTRALESALEGEITDHVGYEKHDATGRGSGNSRNGSRAKTVLTDVGPVEVKVPRNTAGTFESQIVRKCQRRLSGVDEMVLPVITS